MKKKTIRVISPSGSLAVAPKDNIDAIVSYFGTLEYEIQFAEDFAVTNAAVETRVKALYAAFLDKNVGAILCAWGGFNAIQLVDKLNYELIRVNAKPLIGFSDITVLLNAIHTKSGIKTYYGPLFWSFNNNFRKDYTASYFKKALAVHDEEFEIEHSDSIIDYMDLKQDSIIETDYWLINKGTAEGILVGGHIPTFNLLQGSEYFPDLNGKILLLEMNEQEKQSSLEVFNRLFASLTLQLNFDKIKGILIGAFHSSSKVTVENLRELFKENSSQLNVPIIANCNFGHVLPAATWTIGGRIKIKAEERIKILALN
jgi:muramoyltetrapeptide carboxypeptidase